MTKELETKVTNILKSSKSKQEQAVDIFALAELSWAAGDVSSYDSLFKLLRKFFPDIKREAFVLNPLKIFQGHLPDIDLDDSSK